MKDAKKTELSSQERNLTGRIALTLASARPSRQRRDPFFEQDVQGATTPHANGVKSQSPG